MEDGEVDKFKEHEDKHDDMMERLDAIEEELQS